MKRSYVRLAATSMAVGAGSVALATAWWRLLLLLAVLGACAAVPVAHTVFGPKEVVDGRQ